MSQTTLSKSHSVLTLYWLYGLINVFENSDLRSWRFGLLSNLVLFLRTHLYQIFMNNFSSPFQLFYRWVAMTSLYYAVVAVHRCCGRERGQHASVFPGRTQVCFLVPRQLECLQDKRDAENYRQVLEVPTSTHRAAVLVSQRKENCRPLGFEIKLGLIHGPHIAFCATPGRTWSGVSGSVPELASWEPALGWKPCSCVSAWQCLNWQILLHIMLLCRFLSQM